jgi:hypothetical protein
VLGKGTCVGELHVAERHSPLFIQMTRCGRCVWQVAAPTVPSGAGRGGSVHPPAWGTEAMARGAIRLTSCGHNANAASVHYAAQPVLIGVGLSEAGAEVFRVCSAAESSCS